MITKRPGLLLATPAVAACLVVTVGCELRKPAAQETRRVDPQPVMATVAPVEVRSIQRTVSIVGTLHGHDEVTITPKVEGRLLRVCHDVGDRVRSGEVLVEIDPVDLQLAVEEARRALEEELAKIGLKELPAAEGFDVREVPSVVRTRLMEENASRKYRRAESLRARSAISQDEEEQSETDYKVAQATHRQTAIDARATLASARHKQALLAIAEQRLKDTKVLVPACLSSDNERHGTVEYSVSQRMVSEGEMVRAFPSMAVFALVMDDPLKLMATVPERYVSEVKNNQPVQVRVDAYPNKVFEGAVARLNPTVDPINRTFQIEIRVPNRSRLLRAGSFAKANIITRVDPQARTVPIEAIVTFAGVTKVFEVRDGKSHEVEVKTGVRGRGWVEVTGDLRPDGAVITSGQSQLAEGTPVRIRDASSSPGELSQR